MKVKQIHTRDYSNTQTGVGRKIAREEHSQTRELAKNRKQKKKKSTPTHEAISGGSGCVCGRKQKTYCRWEARRNSNERASRTGAKRNKLTTRSTYKALFALYQLRSVSLGRGPAGGLPSLFSIHRLRCSLPVLAHSHNSSSVSPVEEGVDGSLSESDQTNLAETESQTRKQPQRKRTPKVTEADVKTQNHSPSRAPKPLASHR